jgi:AcrR family transcriptional regulator
MPPKVSFTGEKVLDCAFTIVRKDGLRSLSARRIADELQCSTRPIYAAFASMAALNEAVIEKAREFALNYFMEGGKEADSPFLASGLKYFQFSREEPELFKMLYIEGKMGGDFDNPGRHFAPLLEQVKNDRFLAGISEGSLKRLGTNTWIYTHGLIALIHAFQPANAEQIVLSYLNQIGNMLLDWERDHQDKVDKG